MKKRNKLYRDGGDEQQVDQQAAEAPVADQTVAEAPAADTTAKEAE